ncbi:MAG: YecA family protein [Geminicoccaceae bacterium]|nr:MAG: YecA family protein [Geminicoccaceae bacterium]
MTPDQILDAFGKAHPMSPLELIALFDAALAEADALAPTITRLAEAAGEGVYLLPREENVVHIGLHVLAKAGHPAAEPALHRVVCADPILTERLFGLENIPLVASLLVTAFDGDGDQLMAVAFAPGLDGSMVCAGLLAIAYLTVVGRLDRAHAVAFLRRFETERLSGDMGDPMAEFGWQSAVAYLGAAELRPELEALWARSPLAAMGGDEDKAEMLATLEWSADHPGDPSRLIETEQVAPITDLIDAMPWLLAKPEAAKPKRAKPRGPRDAAADLALDEEEERWLRGFLVSPNVPASTIPLEALDGLFAALVAGPEPVAPPEYLPVVFGDGEPNYASAEQAEYVQDLFGRHWATIETRLAAGQPHEPLFAPATLDDTGRYWARGFILGVNLRHDGWRRLIDDTEAGDFLGLVVGLIQDELGDGAEPIDGDERSEVLENLGRLVQFAYFYWRQEPTRIPNEPARSTKIGRNAPCPCGSGKKYKKCCGAG